MQEHVNHHLDVEDPMENPSARIVGGPKAGQTNDIDDQKTFTKSVMQPLLNALINSTDVNRMFIDTDIDHYATGDYDRGWGNGYRNIQMMFSAIFQVIFVPFFHLLLLFQYDHVSIFFEDFKFVFYSIFFNFIDLFFPRRMCYTIRQFVNRGLHTICIVAQCQAYWKFRE